jgi:branched-chain amino acid transport system permease protein
VLALLAAPWLLPEYWLAQLTFILIYGIVGLGLMLLAGFTGQFSLGHAAFLGVGAYTQAVLAGAGWPFPLAWPARPCWPRRWAWWWAAGAARQGHLPGHRHAGLRLHRRGRLCALGQRDRRQRRPVGAGARFFGWSIESTDGFYFAVPGHRRAGHAGHAQPAALAHRPRLRRHPRLRDLGAEHGHPPGALQDAVVRAVGRAGRHGGALYAHKLQFISPDQFNILQSIDLLLMIVIGGLGSVHGAFLGAMFLISMPQLIALGKDYLPEAIGQAPGLQAWSTAWC